MGFRTERKTRLGMWILLATLVTAVTGKVVAGDAGRKPAVAGQSGFGVAEHRMKEIQTLGAQLAAYSRESLPDGLSAADRTEAGRFVHWMHNSSRKFQQLAQGWYTFLQRVPHVADLEPERLERLQEMNRGFTERYIEMVNGAANDAQAFRFENPVLRARHERVTRLVVRLQ